MGGGEAEGVKAGACPSARGAQGLAQAQPPKGARSAGAESQSLLMTPPPLRAVAELEEAPNHPLRRERDPEHDEAREDAVERLLRVRELTNGRPGNDRRSGEVVEMTHGAAAHSRNPGEKHKQQPPIDARSRTWWHA